MKRIDLKPTRADIAAPQDCNQPSGVKVIASWFPLPASGKAYIKCKTRDIAGTITCYLNRLPPNSIGASSVQKKTGDISITVRETDDEITVREKLEECCPMCVVENVVKITVPAKPTPDLDLEVEKQKLVEVMKDYGAVKVLKPWLLVYCKKVRAPVIFKDLESAQETIENLNGVMGKLGERRLYMEFESKREVTCDGRLFEKIRSEVNALKSEDVDIEVEQRQKRRKIIVTGENPEVGCLSYCSGGLGR